MRINIKNTILIATMAFLLHGCGGGTGFTVAEGGISGTGITMGRISNFGSIYVNGIRFDVSTANFTRDGVNASEADYSVGEYVVVTGAVDATGTSGTASEVVFSDLLEGAVTTVSVDNKTIEILGQTINTDLLTVLHGFNQLTDLNLGNIVEVSGLKDAAGSFTATSIKLKSTSFVVGVSENELKGTVANLNTTLKTFTMGSLTVEYGSASLDLNGQSLQDGLFVEVKSTSMILNNNLVATEIELEDEYPSLAENTEVEIEGSVTRFVSTSDFDVNGIPVTTTSTTRYEQGVAADIAVGMVIEVEGETNASGVVVAEEISFKETEDAIELEGNIQSIDLAASEIEVSSQVVVIDSSTVMVDDSAENEVSLTISDLLVDDLVEIKAVDLGNGKILATKLERKDD